MDSHLMNEIAELVNRGRLPEHELRALVARYAQRSYKMCQLDISDDAVHLILDAVRCYEPRANEDQPLFLRGLIAGLEMALASILHSDEDAAEDVLREALADTEFEKAMLAIEAQEAEQIAAEEQAEWGGYRIGDDVVVALECPGPGTREPQFLRRVEGKIVGLPDGDESEPLLSVQFHITEDDLEDWLALMPDGVVDPETDRRCRQDSRADHDLYTVGSTWIDYDINPQWVLGKVRVA